jgi:predicted transcriptional regulator
MIYQHRTLDSHTIYDGNSKRSVANNNTDQKSVYPQSGCKYSFDIKKKRTELGQLLQILEYIESTDDTIISSISRSNNMSHDTATRNCEKLASVGLVTRETSNGIKKYKLTSKGISFLNDCRNFEDILYRYDLHYSLYH